MILAIIQARMSSTRLPGKSMMPICGKPMLQWVIEAAQKAKQVDKVIVATSNRPEDKQIIDFAGSHAGVFTGDLEDVLDRYHQAALAYKPTHIVRLTSDCPMSQPEIIDDVVKEHLLRGYDYTSNRPWFPSGLDVEVFSFDTLLKAGKLATEPHEREHVTPYMKKKHFRRGEYRKYEQWYEENYGRAEEKLSVDTLEDYWKIKTVMEGLCYDEI